MTDKTIGTLNRLIALCRDGEDFYGSAAEKVKDARLQQQFREMATLHREIGGDLRPYVATAGGSAAEGGTLAGKTRQLFATIRTMVTSNTEQTLVTELKAVEDSVVDAFEKALDEPILEEARQRVAARLEDVRSARARMQSLERTLAAA